MRGLRCLHLAQQALFRGEKRARAVDVDRAAFEHDAICQGKRTDFASCAAFAIRLPIFSSCRQLEYFAQALKRNSRARLRLRNDR